MILVLQPSSGIIFSSLEEMGTGTVNGPHFTSVEGVDAFDTDDSINKKDEADAEDDSTHPSQQSSTAEGKARKLASEAKNLTKV